MCDRVNNNCCNIDCRFLPIILVVFKSLYILLAQIFSCYLEIFLTYINNFFKNTQLYDS
jgi:hypothetical protein